MYIASSRKRKPFVVNYRQQNAKEVAVGIGLSSEHPLVEVERRMLRDPWVEVVSGNPSWVVRIMRPRKPIGAYPGFVQVMEGWYQWVVPGDITEGFSRVRRFYKRHHGKVIFHLRCSYDHAVALVT